MKKHKNFSKAVEELMNGKFSVSGTDTDGIERVAEPVSDQTVLQEQDPHTDTQPGFTANAKPVIRRVESRAAEAVITEDMVIKGTVNASANILIAGTILGDVCSEGDIVVTGRIEGNMTVHSLSVQAGTITGDVVSSDSVTIAENSSVDGNIKAERIEVDGKVVGNLESATKIVLHPRSVIEGNVSAMELSMIEGAELKGNVSVHRMAQ
jgi:cytoskeletal protein CcmA (bactofilin family)